MPLALPNHGRRQRKALLCSAGGARAIEAAGQDAVRDVLRRTLAEFQDRQSGVVTLVNTFRWVAAGRKDRSADRPERHVEPGIPH